MVAVVSDRSGLPGTRCERLKAIRYRTLRGGNSGDLWKPISDRRIELWKATATAVSSSCSSRFTSTTHVAHGWHDRGGGKLLARRSAPTAIKSPLATPEDTLTTLILAPRGVTHTDGEATLGWTLHADGQPPFALTHTVPERHAALLTDPSRGDHALVVALLHAMRHGWDIRVEGDVSPRLLDGLETLAAIWWRWRPDRYSPVAISAAREVEAPAAPPDAGGLFAFSGGVDGSYTFFKHLQGAAGRATCRPAAALFVHGMDIPLEQPEVFEGALARGRRMLKGTGVPLLPIRTNARQLGMAWQKSFGLQLIGCYLCFEGSFTAALHGSGEPYETLVLPWGSTPMTDRLCSTASLAVHLDGCEANRSEKVDWLVRNTRAADDLRVCWQGPTLDRNCGRCEKCVRTMLNFWCLGHAVPAALPGPLTPQAVATLQPRKRIQLAELESILRLAEVHRPTDDPILKALQRVVWRSVPGPNKVALHRLKHMLKAQLGPDAIRRLKALKHRLQG
jgi:hypothetical protein